MKKISIIILLAIVVLAGVSLCSAMIISDTPAEDESITIKLFSPELEFDGENLIIKEPEANKNYTDIYALFVEGSTDIMYYYKPDNQDTLVISSYDLGNVDATFELYVMCISEASNVIDSDPSSIEVTLRSINIETPVIRIDGDILYVDPVIVDDGDMEMLHMVYVSGILTDNGYWCLTDGRGLDLSVVLNDFNLNSRDLETGTYNIYVQTKMWTPTEVWSEISNVVEYYHVSTYVYPE